MTQEEKQLLLKDICERLSYGVKGQALGGRDDTINVLVPTEYPWVKTTTGLVCHLDTGQFKPYLRPMSSMTEDEKMEYDIIKCSICPDEADDYAGLVDWLNSHYFDYRGLIGKGLAIEAPENMYIK
jgi:hypothetical protein